MGGSVRIALDQFTFKRFMFMEIFRGGIPSLLRQGLASVATIALNFSAGAFGDTAVAAISIVARLMMIAVSVVIGFGQGFQPICGFNYGAKRYDRVRSAFWFSVKLSTGILLLGSLTALLFAEPLMQVFLQGYPEVTRIGALSLRLQSILLPTTGFLIISNMMLQTMGMARKASLVAVSRQGLFFLPAVLLLPPAFGLLGVQLAQPVSDLCSLLLTVPLTLNVLTALKREEERLAVVDEPVNADVSL